VAESSFDLSARSARYGRRVRAIKTALPLIALALVALVVIWPRFVNTESSFMLSVEEITNFENILKIKSPRIAATDAKGRPVLITAGGASQDGPDSPRVMLERLQADLTLDQGHWVSLQAASGVLNWSQDMLDLAGNVSIFSDIGYEFHAASARWDLDSGLVLSSEPVRGHGPFGRFEAGAFTADIERGWVRFKQGVTLRIFPQPGDRKKSEQRKDG
jgi:lipopolysaccharide export system protein LptC